MHFELKQSAHVYTGSQYSDTAPVFFGITEYLFIKYLFRLFILKLLHWNQKYPYCRILTMGIPVQNIPIKNVVKMSSSLVISK